MKTEKKNMFITWLLSQQVVMGFASQVTTVFASSIVNIFNLTKTELGMINTINFILMIVVPLIVGRLADTMSKKKILITGIFIQYLGTVLISFSPNVILYIAGFIVRGTGSAIGQVTNTSAIVDTYPDKATRYYSYMQSFGCAAGILAPIVLAYFSKSFGIDWRLLMFIFSTLSMLPAIGLFSSDIKNPVRKEGSENTAKKAGYAEAFKMLTLPLLFTILTLVFFCAMDNPYMGFMELFFTEGMGSDLGAIAITVHSIGYAVSRFLAGYITERTEKASMIVCSVMSVLALIATGFVKSDVMAVVLIGVISFFAGPIYPIAVMRATRDNPENTATAVSLMTVGNGIGGATGNLLTGAVSDNFGIQPAFGLLSVFSAICLVMYFCIDAAQKRKKAKQA